jgi:hypothetical protein
VNRLSAKDVVWLNILKYAKNIGLSNEEISDLRKALLSKTQLNNERNIEELKRIIQNQIIPHLKNIEGVTEEFIEGLVEAELALKNNEIDINQSFMQLSVGATLLEQYIYFHLTTGNNGGLIFYNDHSAGIYFDNPLEKLTVRMQMVEGIFERSFCFLSFKDILGKLSKIYVATQKEKISENEEDDSSTIWDKGMDRIVTDGDIAPVDKKFNVVKKNIINPKNKKIEQLANEEKNQDLIIKVRDGVKASIEQIILEKKYKQ